MGIQAFASPPDMASSGVWEIVILPKTPTVDGVSVEEKLSFLIACSVLLLIICVKAK